MSLRTKLALAALSLALLWQWWSGQSPAPPRPAATPQTPVADGASGVIDAAFRDRMSGLIVLAEGEVVRLLADDREGSAHQRFVVRLSSGLTLLVAHNIDLAPRVPRLAAGTPIRVRGQYEWNERGGVVHWTHHDPSGRRAGGWIEYEGRRYE